MPWKEAGHLIRLLVLLAVVAVLFLGARHVVVPPSFGEYGHFRGAALEEIRSRPLHFAGREACALCHEEVVKVKQAGKHVSISCEACHGPQAKHADDPTSKPPLPEVVALCSRCHEANSARPKGFPQVATKEHSGGESCATCHKPHRPKFGD